MLAVELSPISAGIRAHQRHQPSRQVASVHAVVWTWPGLLAEEGRGPPGHLVGRDIFGVLAHHPLLAERVTQPAAALAVELTLQAGT
jgi:hypothetical protein